jgi:CubicO group peptidase (beta-lactamase class C family)
MIALAGAAALASAALAQPDGGWEPDVRRLAQPLVEAQLVPGLVVGIVDQGQSTIVALGTISTTNPNPPTADTIYEIGSVSKVFTAILLAEAVERGEVRLDTPLQTLLPEGIKAPAFEGKEIVLEDLSTHFSALPRLPSTIDAASLDNPYAACTRDRMLEFLNTCTLTRPPGERYEYSNYAVGLLGTLLADRAKTTYATLLRDRIASPLQMTDTVVELSPDQKERLAPGHRGGLPVSNWDLAALVGAGGIRSSVNDLLKLVAAQIEPERSPLQPSLSAVALRRRDIPGAPLGMALGWHIAADKSTRFHNGQTGGYASAVFVNPTLKKGVVVLSNGADSIIDVVAEKTMQAIAGMKVEPPVIRPSIALSDEQLAPLPGIYRSPLGFSITITRRGDALLAQLTGQPAIRIYPESPTRFFYREVQAELEFEPDPSGTTARAVTLRQNGRTMRCERAK